MNETSSHLVPHIRKLSNYLGVAEIYEIASEYQEFADSRHAASLQVAKSRAYELASMLAPKAKTSMQPDQPVSE